MPDPEPARAAAERGCGAAAAAPGADLVRREGRIGGRRVAWHEGGRTDGPTLVLIHGGGADAALVSWPLTLRAFPERRVIAPDLPGYGGSARAPRMHTIGAMAGWMRALLDEARVAPGAVAGVSMGGAVAIALALAAPDRVRALIPVAAYGLGGPATMPRRLWLAARLPAARVVFALAALDERWARRILAGVFEDPARITPAMLRAVRAAARRQASSAAFARFLRHEVRWGGLRTDLSERLGGLAMPTLVVHGRGDPLVPARASQSAAARIPGARLALVEGGHVPMLEAPEPFHASLRGFLDGLD